MTYPVGPVPDGAYVVGDGKSFGDKETEAGIRAQLRGPALSGFQRGQFNLMQTILGGFSSIVGAIFGTVNNSYVSQLPIITDHTQTLTDLVAAVDRLILQGNSIVFASNNTYYPSEGLVSIDIIKIGAGAGGAGSAWDQLNGGRGGGGGGGGGCNFLTIPAALIEPYRVSGIPITVGEGGEGGRPGSPGVGGGDTTFGVGLPIALVVGGGTGGMMGGAGGPGGPGMIPGGSGGGPAVTNVSNPSHGGHSSSAYDLHGGGGGGGGGGYTNNGFGGTGGISPGGQSPSQPGTAPSPIVATGGGAGAGGYQHSGPGGGGALAAGGGGAGFSNGGTSFGGKGGNGILYVIERTT